MNYPPPTAPAPAASARPAQRSRRSGRRSRRKKNLFLRPWQIAVLLLLLAGAVYAFVSWNQASARLSALRTERENARIQYENEVARHQVKYRDLIEYYAAVYNVDPAYVAAIIKRESDYDPRAVSSKNARGLMQFMPDTFDFVAPNCGLRGASMDVIYEPENAIKMGCWLLNYISRQFDGDPILVACAYHAGWGNVRAWVQKYSTDGKTLSISQIPMDDTRYYARKVMEAYAIYQQHYY